MNHVHLEIRTLSDRLVDVLRETAAAQGRKDNPDAEPEKGFYYRSDHFE